MPTSSYMPSDDGGKAELLEHLAVILPKYAELLNISADDLNSLKADAVSFRYTLNSLYQSQSNSQHWTAFKNQQRDGGSGNGEWPLPFKLEEPVPPAVSPGIISRLSTLVASIKAHKNYTSAIGQDLWLIGVSKVLDPNSWKPVLSSQIKAGHPVIVWVKGKAGVLEIWVDRSDGKDFVFLNIHTEPNTTDTAPLPLAGTSAIWKYKAIYRLHDEQVGHWSDVMAVTISG